jgi:hypothetical protein
MDVIPILNTDFVKTNISVKNPEKIFFAFEVLSGEIPKCADGYGSVGCRIQKLGTDLYLKLYLIDWMFYRRHILIASKDYN